MAVAPGVKWLPWCGTDDSQPGAPDRARKSLQDTLNDPAVDIGQAMKAFAPGPWGDAGSAMLPDRIMAAIPTSRLLAASQADGLLDPFLRPRTGDILGPATGDATGLARRPAGTDDARVPHDEGGQTPET